MLIIKNKSTTYTRVRIPYHLFMVYKKLREKNINIKKSFEFYVFNELSKKKKLKKVKYTECTFAISISISKELLQEISQETNISNLFRQFLQEIQKRNTNK